MEYESEFEQRENLTMIGLLEISNYLEYDATDKIKSFQAQYSSTIVMLSIEILMEKFEF